MRSISQCLPLPLAALALLATACDHAADPTSPPATVMVPRVPNALIMDGAHGGGIGFYFLPSLVPNAGPFSGTFDATLAPSATICQLNDAGTGCLPGWLMTFSFGGPAPTGITVDPLTESYGANWNKPTLDVGKYRLAVAVNVTLGGFARPVQLGVVDLQVVERKKDPVDPGFVRVVKGAPIPFKFRIETRTVGFVFPLSGVRPEALNVGDEVRLPAGAVDLHGQPASCTMTWTSSNPTVATVDTSGLVHAVAPGSTEIAVDCGGVGFTIPIQVGGGAPTPAPTPI